mmetsp:Transcript_14308/g.56307  ORF Transcript_14308/g.56307 Transcript_14308/m.56307 type:complete len:281 (+) Transcript_14308:146-988(+)
MEEPLLTVARSLATARRVVVFSGAGISAESGISTFRQPEVGVWANKAGLAYFGTPFGWWLSPKLAWKTYLKYFRNPIAAAQPNDGHVALAELEAAHLKRSMKNRFDIVTQNVDGLHQRGGSRNDHVYELHGTVYRHKCSSNHHVHEYVLDPSNLSQGYSAAEDEFFSAKNPPTCSQCSSFLRPDAVLFTEGLPAAAWDAADSCIRKLDEGDVMLVVGTSGLVQPAASLASRPRPRYKRFEINPDPSALTSLMDLHIPMPSGEALPQIVQLYHEQLQAGAE